MALLPNLGRSFSLSLPFYLTTDRGPKLHIMEGELQGKLDDGELGQITDVAHKTASLLASGDDDEKLSKIQAALQSAGHKRAKELDAQREVLRGELLSCLLFYIHPVPANRPILLLAFGPIKWFSTSKTV